MLANRIACDPFPTTPLGSLPERRLAVPERRDAGGQVDLAAVGDPTLDQLEPDRPARGVHPEVGRQAEVADPVRLHPRAVEVAAGVGRQVGVVRVEVGDQGRSRRAREGTVVLDRVPLLGVGDEVPVPHLGFPARPGRGDERPRVLLILLPRRRRPAPPFRPALQRGRAMAVVVDHHLHRALVAQRLPLQAEILAVGGLDVDVAVPDPQPLAGEADQPLDVADLGLLRISEDDDVPPPRVGGPRQEGHVVDELHHQDAVAVEGRGVGQRRLIAAIDARPGDDRRRRPRRARPEPEPADPHGARPVVLGRGVDRVDVAALRAGHLLVAAHQGRRHRPGGDDERLGLEPADQKREDHRHDDRLDRLAVPLLLLRLARTLLLGLGRLGVGLRDVVASRIRAWHRRRFRVIAGGVWEQIKRDLESSFEPSMAPHQWSRTRPASKPRSPTPGAARSWRTSRSDRVVPHEAASDAPEPTCHGTAPRR